MCDEERKVVIRMLDGVERERHSLPCCRGAGHRSGQGPCAVQQPGVLGHCSIGHSVHYCGHLSSQSSFGQVSCHMSDSLVRSRPTACLLCQWSAVSNYCLFSEVAVACSDASVCCVTHHGDTINPATDAATQQWGCSAGRV